MLEQWFYAIEACEIERWDKDAKLSYEADMITERDYYNIIDTAREDGIAAGIATGRSEGFAEGKSEGIVTVAKSMKSKGYAIADIMDVSGLSQKGSRGTVGRFLGSGPPDLRSE